MSKYKSVPVSASGSKLIEIFPRNHRMEEEQCLALLLQCCDDLSGVHEHLKYYDLSEISYQKAVQYLVKKGNVAALRPLLLRTRTEWQKACLESMDMYHFALKEAVAHEQKQTVYWLEQFFEQNETLKKQIFKSEANNATDSLFECVFAHKNNRGLSLPMAQSIEMASHILSQIKDKKTFLFDQICYWEKKDNTNASLGQQEVFKFWVKTALTSLNLNTEEKQIFLNVSVFVAASLGLKDLVKHLLFSPDLPQRAQYDLTLGDIMAQYAKFLNHETPKYNPFHTQHKNIDFGDKQNVNSLFYAACCSHEPQVIDYVLGDINPEKIRPHITGIIKILQNYNYNKNQKNSNIQIVLTHAKEREIDIPLEKMEDIHNNVLTLLNSKQNNEAVQAFFGSPKFKTNIPIDFKNHRLFKESVFYNNVDMVEHLILKHNILDHKNKAQKLLSSWLRRQSLEYFIRTQFESFEPNMKNLFLSYGNIKKEKEFLEQQITKIPAMSKIDTNPNLDTTFSSAGKRKTHKI